MYRIRRKTYIKKGGSVWLVQFLSQLSPRSYEKVETLDEAISRLHAIFESAKSVVCTYHGRRCMVKDIIDLRLDLRRLSLLTKKGNSVMNFDIVEI